MYITALRVSIHAENEREKFSGYAEIFLLTSIFAVQPLKIIFHRVSGPCSITAHMVRLQPRWHVQSLPHGGSYPRPPIEPGCAHLDICT